MTDPNGELTRQERDALAQLPREAVPPAALEDATVEALLARGLLRRRDPHVVEDDQPAQPDHPLDGGGCQQPLEETGGAPPCRATVLLDVRESARAAGEYDRADELRAELEALGVEVQDTDDGPAYRLEASE